MVSLRKRISLFALTVIFTLISCTGSEGHGSKNEFHVNLGGEPSGLNPLVFTDRYANEIRDLVFDTLLTHDLDTMEWRPASAESWSVSPDGMKFTFKLRPGLEFSDGSPLTSADVKMSYDAMFDPEYNAVHLRSNYSLFSGVETPDPLTVIFKVKEKFYLNFEFAASLKILPSKYYKDPKEGKKLNLKIYGSGPYKLESFERGKKLVLAKNEKWWGHKSGTLSDQFKFDKIHYYFVDDPVVALEGFKKGRFDVMEGIQPDVFESKMVGPDWGKKYIKVKAKNKNNRGYTYIGWNLRDPKFKDKRVRIALNYLMNREMMLSKFFYGMFDAANGPIATTRDDNDHSVKPIPFDVEKAKSIFKEAGWKDTDKNGILDKIVDGKKVELSFNILYSTELWQKWLTVYKEDAAKAGVDVNMQLLEWNSFLKNMEEGKFDAVALSWGGDTYDFDFKRIWHSDSRLKGGANQIDYSNPLVDKLIEQHRRTLDRKQRLELSHKIFRMIAEDAPCLWMFSRRVDLYAHNARVSKPKDTFNYEVGTSYWKIKQ
jgi:ABC-type transport system substrate-binding protein